MQPINTMVCRLFCILRTHVLTTLLFSVSI
nr:MAG TPA: hypothetical protein [Caudoviricetes sp.]